jgi:UDP-N-acetylmuramate: L-alanyl-gamma-D-glutamyl-meso-diaminopimelate ligase
MGHEVTGSDTAFDPPMGPALERWGVRCLRGFDPSHLDPAPDRVIVGNVCRRDNVEAAAAIARGLAVTSMPQALAELALPGTSPLVIAGTHVKTTTSAMSAWLLSECGYEPGFFIGGIPKNFDESYRQAGRATHVAGKTSLPLATEPKAGSRHVPFVVEGDEYDSAFFEKTPKFWHYKPEVAVITSIEHDHVDIYPDEASYLGAFREFVRRVPASGLCVAAANDAHVVDIVRQAAQAPVACFALEGDDTHGIAPEWVGAPGIVNEAGLQEFDLFAGGVSCGRFVLPVPGAHNVRNAVAALAAAAQGYGAPLSKLSRALAGFRGVSRRQELLGEPRGVHVYDDFAHHPTAVYETLRALRSKHPAGTLWAVFEPRSATACRSIHQQAYAEAFDPADRVLLAPLGRTNIPEDQRLNLSRLIDDLSSRGRPAIACGSLEQILETLAKEAQAEDTIALLSNGSFGGIHAKLLEVLRP